MADITNWDNSIGESSSPEEWASFVLEHLSNESVLLASGARRLDTSAKLIHVPRLSDSGDADWYDELEEIGPGDPAGSDLELTPAQNRGCNGFEQRSGCRLKSGSSQHRGAGDDPSD